MEREEQKKALVNLFLSGMMGIGQVIDEAFNIADSIPNWISVEDKLPKKNGRTKQSVSVWATDGLTTCEMIYHFGIKKWSDIFGDWFDVTHWMPLPAPPRK